MLSFSSRIAWSHNVKSFTLPWWRPPGFKMVAWQHQTVVGSVHFLRVGVWKSLSRIQDRMMNMKFRLVVRKYTHLPFEVEFSYFKENSVGRQDRMKLPTLPRLVGQSLSPVVKVHTQHEDVAWDKCWKQKQTSLAKLCIWLSRCLALII